jgi:predicted ATPase
MRQAEEDAVWDSYDKAVPSAGPIAVSLPGDSTLELRQSCTIVAGRNGTGKSRLLRAAASQLGAGALFIELHTLTQKVLNAINSRQDLEEMTEEFSPDGADDARLADLSRIIGRNYTSASWFALEIELADEFDPASFLWGGDQTLVPYFRAQYRNFTYSSVDMGLGEFAVHLLFWVIDHYRDKRDLVLLLDEPDAFLPPVAAAALLARLLATCRARGWRLAMTTHSDELIRRAVARGSLMTLHVDDNGVISAEYSDEDPHIAEHLLTRSATENVIFCEDETAWYLISEMLRDQDKLLWRSTSIVWGSGHGGLRALRTNLPRTANPELRFALVFDGDQRGTTDENDDTHWPICFLPGDEPDELFKSLAARLPELAVALSADEADLRRVLEAVEGGDSHDWVNRLGEEYGRQIALTALARLWVKQNPDAAKEFVDYLVARW